MSKPPPIDPYQWSLDRIAKAKQLARDRSNTRDTNKRFCIQCRYLCTKGIATCLKQQPLGTAPTCSYFKHRS